MQVVFWVCQTKETISPSFRRDLFADSTWLRRN